MTETQGRPRTTRAATTWSVELVHQPHFSPVEKQNFLLLCVLLWAKHLVKVETLFPNDINNVTIFFELENILQNINDGVHWVTNKTKTVITIKTNLIKTTMSKIAIKTVAEATPGWIWARHQNKARQASVTNWLIRHQSHKQTKYKVSFNKPKSGNYTKY